MSNPMKDYVDYFRANLPSGVTYDSDIARYFLNNKRFLNEWEVERHLNYITKFGFSAGFDPTSLFASGEQGAWYDPSDLSTLFQDSAGTTAVTADGDPVGLMLDKSQGLALSTNIADHDIGPLGSTSGGRGTLTSVGDGYWECETTTSSLGSGVFFSSALDVLNFGSVYEVEVDIQSINAPSPGVKNIQVAVTDTQTGGLDYAADLREASVGTYKFKLRARTAGSETILFTTQDNWAAGDKITLKLYVRELPGNHATQSTSAARPVYRTDGTYHWLAPDKVDDRMTAGVAGDFNFLHDGTGCEWFFAAQPASVANPDSIDIFWITGTTSTAAVGAHSAVDDRSATNNAFRIVANRGIQGNGAFSRNTNDTISSLTNAYVFGGGHATSRTPNYFANRDATEVYSGNYDNAPSTANSTNPLTLFATASNGAHFGGKFYGGLFIDRLLTSSEQSATRQYLADKSGVTL